ncbi:RNA polymerase I enhancer binding protein [Mortierella sp. AD011]|nr:RNA polymerase I enhancer binding protein [Mortierella sp. AD010]KAF9403457.1 RNA polymerase I enhancer binding protein [Mortierella sp. AD011]
MDDKHTKVKKRKKSKSGKRDRDELNAGVFKKALITPTAGAGSSTANIFSDALGELDLLGANVDSADDASDSSDDESRKRKPVQGAKSVASSSISASQIMATTGPASKATEDAASTAAMATMADILVSAGVTNQQRNNNGTSGGETSGDALKLQQHLQQNVPAEQEVASTRLTRDQILESIAGIPAMQMLLQTNLSNDNASQQRVSQTPIEDATTILMNLSNDPSILATLNHSTLNNNVDQQQEEGTQDKDGSKKKEKKKKSKAKEPKDPKEPKEPRGKSGKSGEASGSKTAGKPTPAISLESQMEMDMASMSDNILHTKWMMATELKERGITYRTGTFSAHEDQVIKQTIREYLSRHNMEESSLVRWFQGGDGKAQVEKNELKPLWVEIAVRLETRPLLNIYLHVRRLYHPQNNVGQWTKQDDAKLIELHAKHKGQWTTIGQELGRMADSCRDRYRNHLKDQSTMLSGAWGPHEDEMLLDIMHDQALKQGKSNILESTHLWTTISEKMGGTRTRHQCRHRFSQTLQPRLERGDFIKTKAGAAVAASIAAKNLKANTTTSKQQKQQQGMQDQSESSSTTTTQGNYANAEEELRALAAALQGVLPNSSNENILWTHAMTTSTNDGTANEAGSSSSTNNPDHNALTAAIAAAAGLPLPSSVPKASGAPICPKARQQLLIETLRLIQKHDYQDHLDVKWNDLMKEIKTGLQEHHDTLLSKFSKAQEQLQLQAQQHLQDGSSSSLSATAAAAAMTVAVAAVQTESMQVMHNLPAGSQALRAFLAGRAKIEGYRELGLKTVVEVMSKNLEEKIDRRDQKVYATAMSNAQKSGGVVDPESIAQRKTSKTIGPVHERHLAEFAQHTALEALMTQFPLLNQLRQRQQQRQQQQQHTRGDASEDEQETFSWASIATVADARSMDETQREQALQQQRNRDLAEKMIQEAMTKQGLPAFANRNQKRIKALEGFKTKEYVSDTDVSDNGSDEDDE